MQLPWRKAFVSLYCLSMTLWCDDDYESIGCLIIIKYSERVPSSCTKRSFVNVWSVVIFETLVVTQPVKEFPAVYGTRRFNTVIETAWHSFRLTVTWFIFSSFFNYVFVFVMNTVSPLKRTLFWGRLEADNSYILTITQSASKCFHIFPIIVNILSKRNFIYFLPNCAAFRKVMRQTKEGKC
jgi:hypothetical protein